MISKAEVEFYKKIIPNCKVIFDVGCRNDAIFSDINPHAEVHLFDPMPDSKLKYDARFNNFGFGSKEDVVDFYHKYGSFMHRTEEPKFEQIHQTVTAKIRRPDDYCEENDITHIDFLKIDTEGWDFEVMLGAGEMLENIKYIQFEFFHYYANDKHIKDLFDFLKPRYKYEVGDSPMNYFATFENVDYLTRVQ